MNEYQKKQLAYIRAERAKMRKLEKARLKYVTFAHSLGLHALSRDEIHARFEELADMEKEARTSEYANRQETLAQMWSGVAA